MFENELKKGMALMNKGNTAFDNMEYLKAIDFYNEAAHKFANCGDEKEVKHILELVEKASTMQAEVERVVNIVMKETYKGNKAWWKAIISHGRRKYREAIKIYEKAVKESESCKHVNELVLQHDLCNLLNHLQTARNMQEQEADWTEKPWNRSKRNKYEERVLKTSLNSGIAAARVASFIDDASSRPVEGAICICTKSEEMGLYGYDHGEKQCNYEYEPAAALSEMGLTPTYADY